MAIDTQALITPDDAADLLGIPARKIRDMLRKGEMEGIKEKGKWLIPRKHVLSYTEKEKPLAEEKPSPFLKWAGGKTQMLKKYHPLFPDGFRQY
ncbi:MAG: helix-turn-helix domain-containing protein, partial [Candidatus Eremiobacteraeota bacterium]|nr:helix-turn-helix domain-containing protein [Candidatus Eremiobacteraeota bacterium]